MGWKSDILKNLCLIGDGNHSSKYPKKSEMVECGVPFIRGTNIVDGELSDIDVLYISEEKHAALKKGHLKVRDVLFTNRGEIGKVAIVDERFDGANLNSQIAWLRCGEHLTPQYLYYFMQSNAMRNHFNKEKSGAALQQFPIKMLNVVKVNYPPIPEQKRIVAILDQAFADIGQARATTEKNLKNARELFESYLQQVFSQRGEGWDEITLGDAAEVSTGGTPLKSKNEFWGGDIPWYSSGELNDTFTLESKSCISAAGLDGSNAKIFPEGSLLIGMYDTAALKMSILDRDGAFNQAIAGVKPNNKINLEFILHSINFIKPELLKLRRGVRQKNLNQSKIKGIPIRLPSLSEQNQIVDELRLIRRNTDDLAVIYTQKLNDLDELKKSILQKAFSGELTKEKEGAVV